MRDLRSLLVPALTVVLAAGLAACDPVDGAERADHAATPRPVLTRAVAFEPRVAERSFVGVIRPRVESDLGFRVTGKVARRLVSVGDVVTAGEALATLDEVDLKLQAEQAEAERSAAAASLAQTEADFRRGTTLSKQGWTTAATVDRQRAAAEEARGRLARAERALSLARNATSYAVLEADADGVVTATSVEPGQVVAAGQAAIRLARTAEKEAAVSIPETLLERVRTAKAEVSLWSSAGRRYEAVLRELSPAADAATRTYLARFSMPSAGAEVQLGMTATVTLADKGEDRVMRLPLTALFNQGEGASVWTVGEGGKLTPKPVTVASYEAKDVLVSSGLAEGDRVVTLGVQKLDAKAPVRAVDALAF
ncbi:efflux RND transporter periplasmic adaptor subunit [Hansschlegelia zhihuaiae]|uniref:Efflux RND transporter periplasmic adaptor subunit n=1 Tax=Hansschlegelia zhihuaiae TaxID=405005 RepID=A0A4V1KJ37_9HYPH|nr:efflux RND transporter periplasmic adaptor subunit [Hansschlegelia zhihuaiae]RXF72832.1 efflux RND transporter periplasmic adaptor subunit [Hansschlegelia zhihuaiae]